MAEHTIQLRWPWTLRTAPEGSTEPDRLLRRFQRPPRFGPDLPARLRISEGLGVAELRVNGSPVARHDPDEPGPFEAALGALERSNQIELVVDRPQVAEELQTGRRAVWIVLDD